MAQPSSSSTTSTSAPVTVIVEPSPATPITIQVEPAPVTVEESTENPAALIFAGMALLISAAAAGISWRTSSVANRVAGVGLLRSYTDEFASERLLRCRKATATAYLSGDTTPSQHRRDVLNFLEDVAHATRTGAIKKAAAWNLFADFACHYWFAFADDIARLSREPGTFKELKWLVREFEKLNRKARIPNSAAYYAPLHREFFELERDLHS